MDINGEVRIGTLIVRKVAQALYDVCQLSNGHTYQVDVYSVKCPSCECADWVNHKPNYMCRHIAAALIAEKN